MACVIEIVSLILLYGRRYNVVSLQDSLLLCLSHNKYLIQAHETESC